MTADEMRQRNIDAMGETLGTQYTIMVQEVSLLHLYWGEFLELFGTNDKTIKRLNQAAPGFFRMLQGQQFETNMLHMARLTDSPQTAGKNNLTVLNLPNLVADDSLKKQVDDLLKEVKNKTRFCKDWRNRRFAHHDLALAVGDGKAQALKAPTKEKIQRSIESAGRCFERYRTPLSSWCVRLHCSSGT